MEDNSKLIEPLFEKAVDYGKTSYELLKLRTIDKTSEVVSTVIPLLFVIIFIALFLMFISLGLAFLLGDALGKTWYGFFIMGAFYFFSALIIHFWLNNWLKKLLADYIIKLSLK
jgi:fatty acid desaturase